jgi:hypothetical protein
LGDGRRFHTTWTLSGPRAISSCKSFHLLEAQPVAVHCQRRQPTTVGRERERALRHCRDPLALGVGIGVNNDEFAGFIVREAIFGEIEFPLRCKLAGNPVS